MDPLICSLPLAEAQVGYMGIGDAQSADYSRVKAAILDQMGLSAEWYRQKFQSARWSEAICPRAFAQKLIDWAARWLSSDDHGIGEVMTSIILEQLLQCPPEVTGVWVW